MPTTEVFKIKTKRKNLFLRVVKGHFATSYTHSNYYIDVADQKSRYSEAKAVAEELCSTYNYSTTIVDTILCLDGTEVIGACLANELTKNSFANINAHQTVYVVTPEITNGSQMLFRDNIVPMIKGKHVLVILNGKREAAQFETKRYKECFDGTVQAIDVTSKRKYTLDAAKNITLRPRQTLILEY